jgi:anti-sigma B factor antagonist
MSLSLTTRMEGSVCHAAIAGALTLGATLVEMSRTLDGVLEKSGADGLVLNLTEVSEIDSAGLGELVNIYKHSSDRRIRIAVTGGSARIKDLLEVTHLDELLPHYESEDAARSAVVGAG